MHKYWHIISLSLFIFLIASLLFWPEISGPVAIVVFLSGLTVSMFFIVRRNLQARAGVTPIHITLRILIEIIITLLIVLIASLAGMKAAAWLGLIIGMLVAFGVVWALSRLLQALTRRTA